MGRDVAAAAGRTGRLVVVGTPIGNLGDLSPRAEGAFRDADAVLCEDTRVTGRLLAAAGISKPLVRCDENVIARRAPELVERMDAGEVLAFASDAGMPGVSDPGQVLVEACREAGLAVDVVPGPTACITALVASGISCDHFFFEGFLPRRPGERLARLRGLAPVPGALLIYESPHRVQATLDAVAEVFPHREAALCRELTKMHEEVLRAPAPELADIVRGRDGLKGEVVVVIGPPAPDEEAPVTSGGPDPDAALEEDVRHALEAGESVAALAKRLSRVHSRRRREVYSLALQIQEASGAPGPGGADGGRNALP